MCSDDPFYDGISDLVVHRPVVGTADEELVLSRGDGGHKPAESQSQRVRVKVRMLMGPRHCILRYNLKFYVTE